MRCILNILSKKGYLFATVMLLGSATIGVSQAGAASDTVTTTIGVGYTPNGVAVNSTTNFVYTANHSDSVSVINGTTNTVNATITVFNHPNGIAVNPTTNLVYVTCDFGNSVSVINGTTNTVTAKIPVGIAPDGIAVNPSTNMIYVANTRGNSVSIINGATNTVVKTIGVGAGSAPNAVAVNTAANLIYVAEFGSKSVSVINGATNIVTKTIYVGRNLDGIAVNPTTNLVYVAAFYDNRVSVINGTTNTVTKTLPVGTGNAGIVVNPKTNVVYVANYYGNYISVINGITDSVIATIGVGKNPYGVGINSTTNLVYAANTSGNSVSVIGPRSIPGAPPGPVGVKGYGEVEVLWVPPVSNGGDVITSYTVTSSPEAKTCTWTSGPLSCTVSGLTNGQGYTFTVVASNVNGDSIPSDPSPIATPSVSPSRVPTSVFATSRSNTSSVVSWSPPVSDGGSSITSYTVTSSPEAKSCTWTSGPLSCTVTGLTNGQDYTFTVAATNALGDSEPSDPSPSATPSAVPEQPTSVVATSRSDSTSVVSWSPPVSDGGSSITSYTVTSSPEAKSCTWTSGPLSCTVTGLTNGQDYAFTVVASNVNGDSAPSVASSTARPSTVPQRPTSVAAKSRSDTSARVTWLAPGFDGASPVTSYTVTSSPEDQTCTWTSGPLSCTVGGLARGRSYTFTVVATNENGDSPSSSPSEIVTPDLGVQSLQSVVVRSNADLTWLSAPPDDKATIQKSSDGTNWTTLGTSTSQKFTITGAGLSYYVRVLSSSGVSSNVIGITTGGLAQQSIKIVSSNGTPVSGGSVTWKMASGSARSSIAYGLLSDGTYTFPAAPGGPVDITLQNAQMPDGAYVSGTFRGVLSADRTFVVRLPAEPSTASHQVQVLTPNGLPVWNAFVSVTNLASQVEVEGTTFTIPSSVDPCSSSYNSSGCHLGPLPTDVNGSISYWGYYGSDYDSSYYSSPTQIAVSYDDGVVTQTPAVIVPTTANVTINLDYEPVVAPVTAVVVATAPGALTPITITLNGGIGANFRGRTAHAVHYLSGKRVTALPPVGYKACAGQVLQGVSNAQGKVTFKICTTQHGQVRFKTPGVLIPGAVSLYVRGAPSTPVLQLKATSPRRGTANLTWAAPTFTGGQPVTSYQVTLSAPGKKSVTASVKTLSVALSGLANATRYSVTVVPITRLGAGRAAGAVISVA